jgi:hypothetical protein
LARVALVLGCAVVMVLLGITLGLTGLGKADKLASVTGAITTVAGR